MIRIPEDFKSRLIKTFSDGENRFHIVVHCCWIFLTSILLQSKPTIQQTSMPIHKPSKFCFEFELKYKQIVRYKRCIKHQIRL